MDPGIATWAATNVGVVTSGTVILVGALTTWDNHRGRDHQVTTIETNLGTRIGDLGTRIDVVDKKVDEVKEEIKHTQAIALGAAYVSFTGNQAMKNKWAKDIEKYVMSDYKDCHTVKGIAKVASGK
ncbi:hypothetical protein P167DRAFT_604357 [Morchella conica CCBAS932]|uniref:Uncharacterized protein n=1 Tax=Morchella conica CCBAS932 TaxID=1392247 RepID=A0A3N4L813_9PEZI|nr:hypothetical protein P167DRAFT_604357 [Morchella conica CCBAS932]